MFSFFRRDRVDHIGRHGNAIFAHVVVALVAPEESICVDLGLWRHATAQVTPYASIAIFWYRRLAYEEFQEMPLPAHSTLSAHVDIAAVDARRKAKGWRFTGCLSRVPLLFAVIAFQDFALIHFVARHL